MTTEPAAGTTLVTFRAPAPATSATTASPVGDLMRHPVVTTEPDRSVASAADAMVLAGIGAVVVVDAGGAVVGILTERDLVRAAAAGADARFASVEQWMTAAPDVIGPDTSVDTALDLLLRRGYRHAPVVVDGELAGIVSMRDLLPVARVRPAGEAAIDAPRGLKGVVVTETGIGDVRGDEGFYHYRQFAAVDLATDRNLEDVWALLIDGELPDRAGRARFADEIAPLRHLPDGLDDLVADVARSAPGTGPLDGLRTVLSAVAAAERFRPTLDLDDAARRADALRIAAVTPTAIAALHRRAHGLAPITPRDDLDHAANYLWMLHGTEPDPTAARAIEQYLILTVDHGFNASTFTGRVVTSTGADVGSAVVAALGALSGPLHGGAPSRALALLDEIGSPERTEEMIRAKVAAGDRIMGFGHAVYRTDDPRSLLLRDIAAEMGAEKAAFARQVEAAVVDTLAELKPGRQLYANVEFHAGVVMEAAGLTPDLFTPTFAVSRVIGWAANVLEQARNNRIIRPSARYVGPDAPAPLPPLS